MAGESIGKGVYRHSLKGGGWSRIFRCKRTVPEDVRAILGRREYDVSLGTDSATEARARALDVQAGWAREIAKARAGLKHPPLDITAVEAAFAKWESYSTLVDLAQNEGRPWMVADDARPAAWKRDRSKPWGHDLTTPPDTAQRIASLSAAIESRRYDGVPLYEETLRAALASLKLDIGPEHPAMSNVRDAFARALLRHTLRVEQGRLEYAAQERAKALRYGEPATLLPAITAAADRPTIKRLIEGYRGDREAQHGVESTNRKYGHIFRALAEALGDDTPVETLKREDCRKVRDLLRSLPSNASKKYPGLTLVEAVEAADASDDDVPRLAPNTLNSYLSNLIAMLHWAVREEWIERNPASGLVMRDMPSVKRRGFSVDELRTIFAALQGERDTWRWWVPAVALYTGARATEICQLRRDDVRSEGGVLYFAISPYDAGGQRANGKRVKTDGSERNVPVHAALIDAGLSRFVERSGERLFDVPTSSGKAVSHEVSRWWAATLDGLKLSDPALTFHSFRHGFRDAAETAGISDRIVRALGGWATKDVSERYGNRGHIPLLKREIDRIDYGFNLAPAPVAPLA